MTSQTQELLAASEEGAPGDALDAAEIAAIKEARHGDPFSLLGPQPDGDGWRVTAFLPGASEVALAPISGGEKLAMAKVDAEGIFTIRLATKPGLYRLHATRDLDAWSVIDPYQFPPILGDLDEHLFGEGTHWKLWEMLGGHVDTLEGVSGVRFSVWAPNAARVSVVGEFNFWDGRAHPMRRRGASGLWEIFIPETGAETRYKYEVLGSDGELRLKSDPMGQQADLRPNNCSVVAPPVTPDATEITQAWKAARRERQSVDSPISIYEVHLGSWLHGAGGEWLNYCAIADELVAYIREMGFTHVEFLPLTEHPFDGSWGYQPVGLFAPTRRFGTPADFAAFIQKFHEAGIGVILDWVPAHFPTDPHGLAQFDGTALYEHADPREGFHQDWNTLIYNFGRTEVQNFLIANALYWTQEQGIDGLRVDAVASMLYRDYSRKAGEWIPNAQGGRENLEAIAFLKRMNEVVYGADPSIVTIAEESTAWPGVSRPVDMGGLGFGFKWNMGWMHDTLSYMSEDPMHRSHHHDKMTFGLHYAFSENFVLPLSHDEVVHGKHSILGRMPGNTEQRFANLRAYYSFMWAHPGKKLLFMGQEFGQDTEWNHDVSLPWHLLEDPNHRGVKDLVRDLNKLMAELPALHRKDVTSDGFDWIDGGAKDDCVLAWLRKGSEGDAPILAVFNFSGLEHRDWRVGVPRAGYWAERLNTDATNYGGAGRGNLGGLQAEETPSHGHPASLSLTLPPLSGLYFEWKGQS